MFAMLAIVLFEGTRWHTAFLRNVLHMVQFLWRPQYYYHWNDRLINIQ